MSTDAKFPLPEQVKEMDSILASIKDCEISDKATLKMVEYTKKNEGDDKMVNQGDRWVPQKGGGGCVLL